MHIFRTSGTCAKEIRFAIEGDTVVDVDFIGGCPGNLMGISSIVKGMSVETVIERFSAINCGTKSTSCPDQLAQALKTYMASR